MVCLQQLIFRFVRRIIIVLLTYVIKKVWSFYTDPEVPKESC